MVVYAVSAMGFTAVADVKVTRKTTERQYSMRVTHLAPIRERKGLLSFALASVVLTPLSKIIPAWGGNQIQ